MQTTKANILGVDDDKAEKWKHILDNIREYPTIEISEDFKLADMQGVKTKSVYESKISSPGKVFVGFEGMPVIKNNAPATSMPVFPGDDIGIDSPKSIKDIAWRTVSIIPYYLYDDLVMLTLARVRLGKNELDLFEKLTRIVRLNNGGLSITDYPVVWVNGCGWPIVINESILQSYTGKIRINPVYLKLDAQFMGLRSVGAFLISGEIRADGYVAYITLMSESGTTCYLHKPWDGLMRIRSLSSMSKIEYTEDDDIIRFDTDRGSLYIVDHPENPWESQPLTYID
ncbi:MAG: hypothetical protein Q7J78_04050 [Clostridiales bacterium]|nr:hypothetical protein [Clostridiales bacterium]